MNKSLLRVLIGGLITFAACTTPNANNEDVSLSDVVTDTTETFTYQLPNGKEVAIAYIFSGNDAFALVTLEGKSHKLETKESSDSSAVYQKDNIVLTTKKTKVFLSYEKHPETEMELINPIFQSYQSSDEDILAIYHSIPKDKPYVVLQREDGNEYLLPQKEAWAKGAAYANDTLTWNTNGSDAILKTKEKSINFKLVSSGESSTPLHQ